VSAEKIGVSGRTSLLVILGDPVAHAQAPALVNAALAARGRDAVLVPLHVARDALAPVVEALRAVQNFKGGVVTMPHKAAIVDLLDEVTQEGRQVGACNVIRREPDGRLAGTMLDGEGLVASLRAQGCDVRGKRVFLVGAGGAAAGIAFAMGRHGAAALTIHNRTREKAERLATRVHSTWPALAVAVGGPDPAGHDVVVNATSLGMKAGDPLPFHVAALTPGTLAAEIITSSEETPFLAEAARRGCQLHRGRSMLAAQIDLMIDFMRP
jgi:shikimate dehydrogenase